MSTAPYGEPRLSERGLMSTEGGRTRISPDEFACLWVLAMADGEHRLMDIVERSGMSFPDIARAADALEAVGLLEATTR